MAWTTAVPILVATCLFALQGVSFLARTPRTTSATSAGRLTLLLAVLGLVAGFLLAIGWLVVSPEYSVIMVQGRFARFSMALVIFTISLAMGLALHVARSAKSLPPRQKWLLAIGAAVGLLSVLRMPLLNPADPEPLRVFIYDLWWPTLLIWIALCMTDAIMVLLDFPDRWARILAVLSVAFLLANVAIHRANFGRWYSDERSIWVWDVILIVTVTCSLSLWTRLFIGHMATEKYRSKRWLIGSVCGLLGALGLFSSWNWITRQNQLPWFWRPWFLWIVWITPILVLLAAKTIYLRVTTAAESQQRRLRPTLDTLILLALFALMAGFADLFHYGSLEPAWDLTGLIFVLVILVELLGGYPLRRIAERPWIKAVVAAEAPAAEVLKGVEKGATAVLKGIGTALKNAFTKPTLGGIAKAVLALILLSLIADIPNRGKTVVQAFVPLGLSDKDEKYKEIGRLLSNRVVNTLGLLREELRPSVITLSAPGNQKSEKQTLDTGEDTSSLQASVKSDFTIPGTGISLPVSWITDQLQAPLNWALGVRVVRGSVQLKPEGGLLVLASSTAGEVWRAPFGRPSGTPPPNSGVSEEGANTGPTATKTVVPEKAKNSVPADEQSPAAQPQTEMSVASEANAALSAHDMVTCSQNMPVSSLQPSSSSAQGIPAEGIPTQVADIGDEIAYKLVASDVNMKSAGMTTSWRAIPCFRRGLRSWDAYKTSGDPADLNQAIAMFRRAIMIDQKFPWAHYYLGLALREDGQPGAAVAQLRNCLQSAPNFHRAAEALAETLYYFDDYYPALPTELTTVESTEIEKENQSQDKEATKTPPETYYRVKEAQRWLQQTVQAPVWEVPEADRAAAYSTLSRIAQEYGILGSSSSHRFYQFYLAYFYGKRAERIFASVRSATVTSSESKAAQAYLLAGLGALLESSGTSTSAKLQITEQWQCNFPRIEGMRMEEIRNILVDEVTLADGSSELHYRYSSRSAYAESASGYYRRALAILPQDASLRCLAASNSFTLGDHNLMEDLNGDPVAHNQRGFQVLQMAGSQSTQEAYRFYQVASREYEWAIWLAPDNVDALNGYANTFWQWRMRDWTAKPPRGPAAEMAHKAEKDARDAVRLVAGDPSNTLQVTVGSTLGEVLLGQGRSFEALHEFEALSKLLGNYAEYNETRWDAALAYICTGNSDWKERRISREQYDKVLKKGMQLLEGIATSEADRDSLSAKMARALDARKPSQVCEWAEGQPGWQGAGGAHGTAIDNVPHPPLFVLESGKPSYASSPPCNWEGVAFRVTDSKGRDVDRVQLHIWGGGLDDRVQPGTMDDHVLLTYAPQDTHDYYFAQLEYNREPVSFVYPIETFEGLPKGTCLKNAVNLHFVQLGPKIGDGGHAPN